MEGNSISILGTLTARKKQSVKLFIFALLLTGQIYRGRGFAAFQTQVNADYLNYVSL